MTTKIRTNDLTSIINGITKAANTVKTTMGAAGKTVIIASDDPREKLRFTKDGVSVAKSLKFEDALENIGAQILISAANETVETCGDGTSLTSVLLQQMILKTFEALKDTPVNNVLAQLEKDAQEALKWLTKHSNDITSIEQIENIAKVSSNSERLGKMFKEIYDETGMNALVTLERSQVSDSTYYEVTKGVQFDSGYVHPSFMTDKATEQAIYENAWIHIEDGSLNRVTPFLDNLVGAFARKQGIPVIIIADSFSDSVIRFFSMNKVNDGVPVCLIKTPGYGYGKQKNIDDLNAYLTPDAEEPNRMNAGAVDKIVIDSYKFIIYNEDTPRLQDRIAQLRELSENAVEWMDSDDYEQRAFKLSGSCATIYAGGQTPEAQSEEYDRLEDAIGAVHSAIQEGYVAGAGATLFTASNMASIKKHGILSRVLVEPYYQILKNANIEIERKLLPGAVGYGVNLKTGKYENLLDAGIIDPTKVLKTAIKNALANTKLLVNTSFALYNQYEK